jgi:hypothetical protein
MLSRITIADITTITLITAITRSSSSDNSDGDGQHTCYRLLVATGVLPCYNRRSLHSAALRLR